jgi:hypothetical protein
VEVPVLLQLQQSGWVLTVGQQLAVAPGLLLLLDCTPSRILPDRGQSTPVHAAPQQQQQQQQQQAVQMQAPAQIVRRIDPSSAVGNAK